MIVKDISNLTDEERSLILNRSAMVDVNLVQDIIDGVKSGGDEALKMYTKRFDGASLENLRVSDEEFKHAEESADPEIVEAIKKAYKNIIAFHEHQMENEWQYEEGGRTLGQIIRAVGSVGCYIPGGRAFYPSTVLMTIVPAKVAGVERIVCTTPPKSDGIINEHILAACAITGVDEVYKVGGAQAVAALAYGTESIPKVDMIAGPGNVYVTAAKKAVFGDVGIDMLAGPSEVLIIADSTGNADFIVTDILAQAEHDPNASCVLVTTSRELAHDVKKGIDSIEEGVLPALKNTAILIADNIEKAVDFSNEHAPEHLEIMTAADEEVVEKIKNAGSIFFGPYSPVAAGDYATGPNHVLPTAGCARFQSGLNVGHFLKRISVQKLSKKGLDDLGNTTTTLAKAEGLKYHSDSVEKRLKL